MDRTPFDFDLTASRDAFGDDDMLRFVDEWVKRFDDPGTPDATALRDVAAPLPEHSDRRSTLDTMRSSWGQLALRDSHPAAAESRPEGPAPDDDALLRSNGLVTVFADDIGGTISLSHVDGRLLHRGTVAVRGSTSVVNAACRDIGLPDRVTHAFEFLAAWFGFPFDAVNVRQTERRTLSWGFWACSGDELARCLYEWKTAAPDAFAAYCGRFGLDVAVAAADEEPAARPQLALRTQGRAAHGRAAERTIATEPRLLAVLARAGRDASAQRAQIELALAGWVTPVMFQPWQHGASEDRLTVDALTSPSSIAALLYLVRRHGRRAAMRMAQAASEQARPQGDPEAWVASLARSLRQSRRDHEASDVMRIASSPELTCTAN